MGDWIGIIAIVLVAFGVVALGWWLLIETEGVYLGRRVVIWLYDLYAGRYDDIKHFRKEYDHMFLAQPIMELIAPVKSPHVLDVATGTGRLPLALLRHAHFQGRVVGVDLSRRMLTRAAAKAADPRLSLLWCPAENLPFPDDSFDVVTCLEALEFMERPADVLRELVRVLRPGGLLFITNRLTARLMPGKAWTDEALWALLDELGIEQVAIDYWQVDYNRVWGYKAGQAAPQLARPLAEVLRCPKCCAALLIESGDGWRCPNCGFHAPVSEDGVIEIGV
jgi:ubiquinone/menaquinone biosynthesis C-methylase UbiE